MCPISVTRLETDLAGVWLFRLLPDTDCRLQLSLNVQTVASQRKQVNHICIKIISKYLPIISCILLLIF
nr:MAG TPA: hypothetical protein [Caudoviricetes sp.]